MGAVIFLLAAGMLWLIREQQPEKAIQETAVEA
jgi:hypothetical protein